jgi:predicted transcriptional regulator
MSLKSKEETRKQTQMLNELRKQHNMLVKHAQELLKEQQTVRKTLQRALLQAPHTVPQLAATTNIAAHIILWHIAAMKKYGIVEEAGMDETGDYYLYSLVKESKS